MIREPRDEALEAAIDSDPYDATAYRVYADWLESQGSPRGRWIALNMSRDRKAKAAATKWRKQHHTVLVGPLDEIAAGKRGAYGPEGISAKLGWRFGYVHTAQITVHPHQWREATPHPELVETFLAHPSCRFLAELRFVIPFAHPNDFNIEAIVDVLARHPRPALRTLQLGEFLRIDSASPRQVLPFHALGALGKLWEVTPALRTLVISGGRFEPGTLELPELRSASIVVRYGGCEAIAAAVWPHLERLEIATPSTVNRAILVAEAHRPKRLGILNSGVVDEICRNLPAMPGLRELDLRFGCMTDDGARNLADNKRIAPLERLDVSWNFLTEAGLALLRDVAKHVIGIEQRRGYLAPLFR